VATRLYADENFPLPVVEALRLEGHDLVTLQERGHGGESLADEAVMALASAEGRALLTLNRRDFIRLQNAYPKQDDGLPDHGCIVVCTVDPDYAALAMRIHDAILSNQNARGHLIRINRPSTTKSNPP
jgi:Domain of unknown function (DUF5615)